jgi:hypothetical protein
MSRKNDNNKLEIGYHVVAFIDVMGQQEHLRQLTTVPTTNDCDEYANLIKSLKNTYGAVHTMRNTFNKYFDEFQKRPISLKEIPIEKRQLAKELISNPIRSHQFSDFVVAFLSLRNDRGAKLPISGVYGMLGATAATSLVSLALGHPIRGGIDIGVGIELKHDEIYGASLARAYALESHIANYPRVVIGEELHEYLIQASNQPNIDAVSFMSAKLASRCLKMLSIDDDGYPFVDFIGQYVREEICGSEVGSELVKKAFDFVVKSSTDFRSQKNSKIAFKYTLLRNYMEPRLKLWGINI